MAKSIFYQSPFFYRLGLKFIHRENFARRYQYLASTVEKGDSVLEPGCGPAILAEFLPKDCLYYGFDLNKSFIHDALSKNLKVFFGDVLDQENYFPADLVISCDILHHLKPELREKFIENCWSSTKKKLIICEPYRENSQKKWFFEYIERDGINNPKFEDFWGKKILKGEMEDGFGKIGSLFPRKIAEIGKDFVVTYFKKQK